MAYDRDKVFDDICDRISKGESLRSVLRDEEMPTRKTFYSWMRDKDGEDIPSKVNQYARATEDRADTIFDEMFDIADDGSNDYTKKAIGEGVEVEVLNNEHIQRSRLRIDTRKWALSKMMPKKYGDRIEQVIEDKRTPQYKGISMSKDDRK